MPVFWLGEMMNLITQNRLHDTWLFSWVPPLGYKPFAEIPLLWFQTLVIPLVHAGDPLHRHLRPVLRAELVEAFQEDYIRTARAKGLTERRVLLRHALNRDRCRSSHVRPGLRRAGRRRRAADRGGLRPARASGKLTYTALQNLDLPVILATVMYASFFVVVANAVVDIVYAVIDPRVRRPEP